MTKDLATEFMQAIAWYNYNAPQDEIILGVYGNDISDGYMAEKLDLLKRKGVLGLFCELDKSHQKRLIQLICDRYEVRLTAEPVEP